MGELGIGRLCDGHPDLRQAWLARACESSGLPRIQRLAVLTYLPHRLSAAEREAESAALDAWFEEY
jgi:hypothetical protein